LGVSEKRLLGWEPVETHEHTYDNDGRLVRTVVTREAEWDDVQRGNLLALADYEDSICGCGFPESIADEDPDLELTHRVCPVCAGLAKAGRIQDAADAQAVEALGKHPAPDVTRPEDGRRIGLKSKPPPESSVELERR
jgi:hypothetical protein